MKVISPLCLISMNVKGSHHIFNKTYFTFQACLLLDGFFRDAIHSAQAEWRSVVSYAVQCGVPTPCFSTALAFYDGYRSERLPANLIQVWFWKIISKILKTDFLFQFDLSNISSLTYFYQWFYFRHSVITLELTPMSCFPNLVNLSTPIGQD